MASIVIAVLRRNAERKRRKKERERKQAATATITGGEEVVGDDGARQSGSAVLDPDADDEEVEEWEEESLCADLMRAAKEWYDSDAVQIFFAVLIFANFVINAAEAQVQNAPTRLSRQIFLVFELFFTSIFAAELLVNMFANDAFRCGAFWYAGANLFDFVIVMVSVVTLLPGADVRGRRGWRGGRGAGGGGGAGCSGGGSSRRRARGPRERDRLCGARL